MRDLLSSSENGVQNSRRQLNLTEHDRNKEFDVVLSAIVICGQDSLEHLWLIL
jgi:hypothetical protein